MLLQPQLRAIPIEPEDRRRVETAVFGALFDHAERYLSAKAKRGVPAITIAKAAEILAARLPRFRGAVGAAFDCGASGPGVVDAAEETTMLFHVGVAESIGYLRREGAAVLREAISKSPAEAKIHLWRALFQNRLRSVIEGAGYLLDREKRESCDLAVECLKLWSENLVEQLLPLSGAEWAPSQLFLDPEADLDAVIEWEGRKLRLRGCPGALMINPVSDLPEVIAFHFSKQGQTELRIAELVLSIALVAAVRGPGAEAGRLQLIELAPHGGDGTISPFPPRVAGAFDGYVGNSAAARRVKIEATVAIKSNDGSMPVNLLIAGPDGIGKSELARRVAQALGDIPLITLDAAQLLIVDDLFEAVARELRSVGLSAEEAGTDSGLPRLRYPAMVIFIDEIDQLGKRAQTFLNLLDPNEKRAAGGSVIGEFPMATILAATTGEDRVPSPLLAHFRVIRLLPYTPEEVGRILRSGFGGGTVSDDFFQTLAAMSRLNPGAAQVRLNQFRDRHQSDPAGYPLDLAGLDRIAAEEWNVDRLGLDKRDLAYLEALGDGPKGFGALTTILPFEKDEIQNRIEPYLIQLGLVQPTSAGRQLTEKGRVYLLEG